MLKLYRNNSSSGGIAPHYRVIFDESDAEKQEQIRIGDFFMTYFTADLHLGHDNVIRFCNRPFETVLEMDEVLIANWNAVIKGNDDIYILGDLFYRNKESAEEAIKRLKGKKHLILGNHDKRWTKTVDLSKYFVEITNFLTYKCDGVKYTLCHYPMLSWPGRGNGGYMIHGHNHNNPLDYTDQYLLNAGVDINDYKPATFNELIQNNERYKTQIGGSMNDIYHRRYS